MKARKRKKDDAAAWLAGLVAVLWYLSSRETAAAAPASSPDDVDGKIGLSVTKTSPLAPGERSTASASLQGDDDDAQAAADAAARITGAPAQAVTGRAADESPWGTVALIAGGVAVAWALSRKRRRRR